ncbi:MULTISPECIES: hypothetical protein [unclassified Bradyrhizobium]|uniref:hypothetical protein n=1 Tax=unclassified Bradyrhizobium TaxID=2631580 RepID=UPI002915EFFA|nr:MULTISPECIES: hypothetical protein [unclassified Bradyrhizobium]
MNLSSEPETNSFTLEQFELLERWGEVPWLRSPEQLQAYEKLQLAHALTERWAEELRRRLFPNGSVEGRKSVVTQGQRVQPYTWSRIYPRPDAPRTLAYTVGIDRSGEFIVKIDTYQPTESLRRQYEEFRGPAFDVSPCAAVMPARTGCSLNLRELVDWSERAILDFEIGYEQAEQILGLVPQVLSPVAGIEEVREWLERWREMMVDGVATSVRRFWVADVDLVMEFAPLPNQGVLARLGTDPTGTRWAVEINDPSRAVNYNPLTTVAKNSSGRAFLLRQGMLKTAGGPDVPTGRLASKLGLEPVHLGFTGKAARRLWYVVCQLDLPADEVRSATAAFVRACEVVRGWAPPASSPRASTRLGSDERGGKFVVPPRTAEEVERHRRHGSVYLKLKETLLAASVDVYKLVHPLGYETDAVVRRRDGSLALVEIKTGSSAGEVHTGVGQLHVYRKLMDGIADAELWLLLPKPIEPDLRKALAAAGVRTLTYELEIVGQVLVTIPQETVAALSARNAP